VVCGEDYVLFGFGGPVPHTLPDIRRTPSTRRLLSHPLLPVFCAFGGATADYSRQYLRATRVFIPYMAVRRQNGKAGQTLSDLWAEMEVHARDEIEESRLLISRKSS